MRPLLLSLLLSFCAVFTACSTPDSRIGRHQAVFAQYPADIQQKIRAGQVDIGFTPEMVVMALGEPERKFHRRSDAGDTEVWSYHRNTPRFSLGFGMSSGGYRSGVGGGVGMSTGGYDPEEKLRIEFRKGVVSGIDELSK